MGENSYHLSPTKKLLSFNAAIEKISQFKEKGKTTILAQGVFDIIHIGHLLYFHECKFPDTVLFVGVATDEEVKKNKGDHRPYNLLPDRLHLVSEFHIVDYVFPFETSPRNEALSSFSDRLSLLKPDFLAVSSHDTLLKNKEISADRAGVRLLIVSDPLVNSTTQLAKKIGLE